MTSDATNLESQSLLDSTTSTHWEIEWASDWDPSEWYALSGTSWESAYRYSTKPEAEKEAATQRRLGYLARVVEVGSIRTALPQW